jgi:hypothetical protein
MIGGDALRSLGATAQRLQQVSIRITAAAPERTSQCGWRDARDVVLKARAAQDANKKARGYPVTPFDPNRIHAE